jgi:c-di-GMP phosphodiesterase
MIGANAIRRWGLLLALSGLRDAPHHPLNAAVVRARMSELVAPVIAAAPDRAFTAGLFSLLDAMDRPPDGRAGLGAPVRRPPVRRARAPRGPEGEVLRATLAYERGDFDAAAVHARPQVLADAYHEAIAWSDQLTLAAV